MWKCYEASAIWFLYNGERIRVMCLNLKAVKRRKKKNGGNVTKC